MKRSAVAQRLGVSVSMIRQLERGGILPTRIDAKGHHVFDARDVDELELKRAAAREAAGCRNPDQPQQSASMTMRSGTPCGRRGTNANALPSG
jgi:hypothetical protein